MPGASLYLIPSYVCKYISYKWSVLESIFASFSNLESISLRFQQIHCHKKHDPSKGEKRKKVRSQKLKINTNN